MAGLGEPPVAVVGAGIGGLTAAHDLNRRGIGVRVFEAGEQIAGLGRSFRDDEGFTYDFGAHFVTNRFAEAVGVLERCRTVEHFGETVWLDGKTYSFPLGLLRSPRFAFSGLAARIRPRSGQDPASAAEWYRASYGASLAEEVAIPLLEAWSGAAAEELAPSVIPPQVDRGTWHVVKLKMASRMSGRAVANGFSREMPEHAGVWHVYPEGGVSTLCEPLAEGLDVSLRSPVQAIVVEHERVVGVRVNGVLEEAAAVISTAPIHILPKLIEGSEALSHLARFRYRPIVLVNLKFEGRPFLPEVTTWVPDRTFPFFRLTEPPLSMPWLAPDGMTMITADIGCETDDPIWTMDEDDLAALCIEHLARIVPSAAKRYRGCRVLKTPVGYPIYLRSYERERVSLESGLPLQGLFSVGRNGEFAHILMEDVYWRTLRRMDEVAAYLAGRQVVEPAA
ncbi:MAG TPA: FAD-dependent oxidoreductase [Acidimicrobiia bacterium]|jgi:protoporphyrinogen oxidase